MTRNAANCGSQSLPVGRNSHKQFPRLNDEKSSFFSMLCERLTLDLSVQIKGHNDLNQEAS